MEGARNAARLVLSAASLPRRVPFILRAPGVAPGRVGEVVRLHDIMPTALDLLDIEAPPVDGVSLVELMRGIRTGLDLEAYAESVYPQRFGWSPLFALRLDRYKFIDAPRPELYDLEADPFEERNVRDAHSAVAHALRQRVREIARRPAQAPAVQVRPFPRKRGRPLRPLGIQHRALTFRGGMNFPIPRAASPTSMPGRDRARLSWRTRPLPAGDAL